MSIKRSRSGLSITVLALFFCLIYSSAFAAKPTLGTISPSSGTTLPSIARTFTCAYSDTDGWANLKEAYLLINTTSATSTNAVKLYYDQNANLLYLRNDTNTAWLGGYAPGSANVIENSYAILDCSLTTVFGSTNTMTVKWSIVFKPAFSGKIYNCYFYVKDDTGGAVGWVKKGTYTINTAPIVGTITPASGTGIAEAEQIFTTTYSDADGWRNIQYVYFLMNTSASGASCLYAYYNQNTNLLYLRNDTHTAWLGGYAPGSANIIENSYAKLNCASTTVSGSGSSLSVNWGVVLKKPFTGNKNTYLYVRDDCNVYQNWIKKGNWNMPNAAPATGAITPSSGSSSSEEVVSFVTTYSDADSWQNIQYVYFLINTSTSGASALYVNYNQNTNKLYLKNNANTAWLGGYAPGSANIIENSFAKLDCSGTTVSGSENTLTVNWKVTFKSTFIGAKKMYLYARDDANAYKNWTQAGTWDIQQGDIIPPSGTIIINTGDQLTNTNPVTLALSATDIISGMGAGAQMQFSNDNAIWSTPEAFAITKTWTLTTGDGIKTVYVKYKDVAGNWSDVVSATVILDTILPEINIIAPLNNAVIGVGEGK